MFRTLDGSIQSGIQKFWNPVIIKISMSEYHHLITQSFSYCYSNTMAYWRKRVYFNQGAARYSEHTNFACTWRFVNPNILLRYSEGSLFRWFVIPKKKYCSLIRTFAALLRRFVIPKIHYSDGSLFRRFIFPKMNYRVRYSEGSLIRKLNRVR